MSEPESSDRWRAVAQQLAAALEMAIDGWEYACTYKGDYFVRKHGDAEDIAEARAALSAYRDLETVVSAPPDRREG